MKNAAKVFDKWFWWWLGISFILVLIMLIAGQPNASVMASIIMALLMVMPVRAWTYRFTVWAIDYVSSINTNFKDRINPHATYNRLTDPNKREENVGFYRTLQVVIGIIHTILALLFMAFQGASFNCVYACLHTIEFILCGRIGALALLSQILLTLAYFYLVYWFVGQVLNGELYTTAGNIDWQNSWWKIVLMSVGFYAKIILSSILLKYTISMLGSSLLFWTVVIGLPILVFEIINWVKRNHP